MLLSDLITGEKIIINENGIETEYIILSHNYSGRTLLWRAEAWAMPVQFGNEGITAYNDSELDIMLSALLTLYDTELQKYIEAVPIICSGETIYKKIFALSASELGYTFGFISDEGDFVTYFETADKRIAYVDGEAIIHWTRSTYSSSSGQRARVTNSAGVLGNALITNSRYVVPAFTLASNMHIYKAENGKYYPFFLITDRTQADVDRYTELKLKYLSGMTAEEKAEWETFLKGAYNYSDMNRVESAVEYVANRLNKAGYAIVPIIKKNWTKTDKPTLTDLKRYMKNISDIRSILATYETTPEAPTVESRLSFQMANAMEQIIADIDDLISKMIRAYFYSGDLYSGEV